MSLSVLRQGAANIPYSVDFTTVLNICKNAAVVIGAAFTLRVVLYEAWYLWNAFHAYFLAPRGIGRTNLLKYGSWAVVTGASDGIGKGYALELAKQGLNVVLISRSEKKLEAVADEIRSKYNCQVMVIVADFTEGQTVFPAIAKALQDLDIAVLVNNVGLSYLHPDYFLAVPKERHRQIVEVNCQTMVQMTHMILPKMLEKKKGVVVNLSSISDWLKPIFLVTYAASKTFVRCFTDTLREEYSGNGVIFQTVALGMVSTTMSNARRVSFFVPDPQSFATSAVATIGIQNYTRGYWPHALQVRVIDLWGSYLQQRGTSRYQHWARKVCLRRKKEGTLISQLQQKNTDT